METPNTTIFENMGEFKLSCLVNSTAKIGKYKLSKKSLNLRFHFFHKV